MKHLLLRIALLPGWDRATLVLSLLIIFGFGMGVGATIRRHGEEARIGRAAYFLALKLNEHRSQH